MNERLGKQVPSSLGKVLCSIEGMRILQPQKMDGFEEMDEFSDSVVLDDYGDRLIQYDLDLKELVEEYLENSIFTSGVSNQTTLTWLVLKTNLTFTDDQYKFMLGLDDSVNHELMFQGIVTHVKLVAREIYGFFRGDLLDLPLTNIKDVVYQIGLNFKEVFFVPIKTTVYESWNNPENIVRYVSRFNEMWLVSCLLNREYQQLASSGGEAS